jgi:hypothetical protein
MNDDDLTPAPEWLTAALADTPPVSADAREAAISRALEVFDRMHTAPNVVAFPNRRRWYRPVAAAAAVMLLGVVAVGALKGAGGSDQDMSSSGTVAVEASNAKTTGGATQDAAAATINAINAAAGVVVEISTDDQLRMMTLPEMVPVTDPGALATESMAPATTVQYPTGFTFVATSFPFTCELSADQVVLGEISWQGTPAVAVRDTVTGVTEAIDQQCNVLATVEP